MITKITSKISDIIDEKYNEWKAINVLVSSRSNNKFQLYYNSISLISQIIRDKITKKVSKIIWDKIPVNGYVYSFTNKNVDEDKNLFILSYQLDGENFNMIYTKNKYKSRPFLSVYDENENDVTKLIISYLGPNRDFHGFQVSPFILGYKSLRFINYDFADIIFNANELIDLSLL